MPNPAIITLTAHEIYFLGTHVVRKVGILDSSLICATMAQMRRESSSKEGEDETVGRHGYCLQRHSVWQNIFLLLLLLSMWSQLCALESAGVSRVEQSDENKVEFSNKLFRASFEKGEKGGVKFGGLTDAKTGEVLVKGGTDIFQAQTARGDSTGSAEMVLQSWDIEDLPTQAKAVRASERVPGKTLHAVLRSRDGSYKVDWRVVLRNGSHYLRQEFVITALNDTEFTSFVPLSYAFSPEAGEPTVSGNTTHGNLVVSDRLFTGLETPMSQMSVGGETRRTSDGENSPAQWTPEAFQDTFEQDVPPEVKKLQPELCREMDGPVVKYVKVGGGVVYFTEGGDCKVEFTWTSGSHKLNIIGVSLNDTSGKRIACDAHRGSAGEKSVDAIYSVQVPAAGEYRLQYWVESKTETITSQGEVTFSLPQKRRDPGATSSDRSGAMVRGEWVRKAKLERGKSWYVSSVIGLLEKGQERRSFLCYSERERAVPYRVLVHYNDWYEVGITRHDNNEPLKRTTDLIWRDILTQWKKELFDKRKTYIDAFVIDDGWDEFDSLWEFHAGFPRGFSSINRSAAKMKAGIGTWLGPVGGYGHSKEMRLSNWNKKHPHNQIRDFKLSNREYFEAFVERCSEMIKSYDMRYFKFDGISTKFHAKGPADLEDAEGIISVVDELRKRRPDIFINATVGTWASPFWFHYVDSVWRQENDFGQAGDAGDARDRWITYRDRLVYEVFVQGAPLFPINCLMTHGTIITRNGPPNVMSKEPANCVKEMRAAFGCGSGLQEVYADADLLNQEGGKLWDELASCIGWIRRNADVLEDVHWVGGNPWDGSEGDVYGWAAWNSRKCTLTLRNSDDSAKTLRASLREIFEIPNQKKGTVTLSSSFSDQRTLPVLMGRDINIDDTLEITLEPLEVIVMEGVCKGMGKAAGSKKKGKGRKSGD